VIVLVGLKMGVFTPTEAAVVAAVYALFVATVVYRELKLAQLYAVFVSAAKTTAVIMFLVAAAMVSAWLITVADLPATDRAAAAAAGHPTLLLMAIMLLVIAVGTAMDMTPTILILAPVLMPVVKAAGIDPVYFGVLFIMNNAIGLITPPVGTVLNVVAGVGKMKHGRGHRGVLPFMLAQFCVLFLLVLFPQIVLAPLRRWCKVHLVLGLAPAVGFAFVDHPLGLPAGLLHRVAQPLAVGDGHAKVVAAPHQLQRRADAVRLCHRRVRQQHLAVLLDVAHHLRQAVPAAAVADVVAHPPRAFQVQEGVGHRHPGRAAAVQLRVADQPHQRAVAAVAATHDAGRVAGQALAARPQQRVGHVVLHRLAPLAEACAQVLAAVAVAAAELRLDDDPAARGQELRQRLPAASGARAPRARRAPAPRRAARRRHRQAA
jgi:hypothetical protein